MQRTQGTYPSRMASRAVNVRALSLLWMKSQPATWKSRAPAETTTGISGGMSFAGCACSDCNGGSTVSELAQRSPPTNRARAATGTNQVDQVDHLDWGVRVL